MFIWPSAHLGILRRAPIRLHPTHLVAIAHQTALVHSTARKNCRKNNSISCDGYQSADRVFLVIRLHYEYFGRLPTILQFSRNGVRPTTRVSQIRIFLVFCWKVLEKHQFYYHSDFDVKGNRCFTITGKLLCCTGINPLLLHIILFSFIVPNVLFIITRWLCRLKNYPFLWIENLLSFRQFSQHRNILYTSLLISPFCINNFVFHCCWSQTSHSYFTLTERYFFWDLGVLPSPEKKSQSCFKDSNISHSPGKPCSW